MERITLDAERLAKAAHDMRKQMEQRHLSLSGKQLENFVQRAIADQVPDIALRLAKGDTYMANIRDRTAENLKSQLTPEHYLEIGMGVERILGVSRRVLDQAIKKLLDDRACQIYQIRTTSGVRLILTPYDTTDNNIRDGGTYKIFLPRMM